MGVHSTDGSSSTPLLNRCSMSPSSRKSIAATVTARSWQDAAGSRVWVHSITRCAQKGRNYRTTPRSVEDGAERSAVSLPCVAVVDGSAQEMFDAVAGLAANSSPRHATGFPALLIGDCGLGDTSF